MNTKQTITLTWSQFLALLNALPGALFFSMVASTDARLRKTGNPLALPVFKRTVLSSATSGADYQTAVNNEAQRQGGSAAFVAGALPIDREWLPGYEGKVLRSKKDHAKLYLRTESTPGQRRKFRVKVLNYRQANGQFADRATVRKFSPPVYESAKQQDTTGIKATVWVRDYLFESVELVKINGQTYKLTK